jgi:hypothetical protein
MNFHSFLEIASLSSLSIPFILKYLSRTPETFEPYLQHGRNNAVQLEDSGLVIFRQIGQLKKQGRALPGIALELAKTGLPGTKKQAAKPGQGAIKPQDSPLAFELYDKLD